MHSIFRNPVKDAALWAAYHSAAFEDNYFQTADKQVELNNRYAHAASEMINTPGKEIPCHEGPLTCSRIQDIICYMWLYAGRRTYQDAAMKGQGYWHWHSVFQL